MAADNNDGKKIQLNRKMRLWNKYKNPIIGAVSVIVIVIAAVVVLRACSVGKTDDSGKTDNKNNNSTTMSASVDKTEIQTTAGSTQETTASVNDNTTQTTAAMASKESVVKITDPADEEEYSTNDLYADTVLFGDMIIEGIQDYGYLGTGNIVSDNNLTTDKAHNYISDVKDRTPSKIFLLVGLNDLNYGTRSGTDVAERIENLVAALKENIPSAKIYVVSLLPVTESFEAKSSVKIKQSDINDANKKLAEDATTMGAVFVDIADSFKDGSGYLNTKYSSGGYNLNHNYYPFFLNKLAGAGMVMQAGPVCDAYESIAAECKKRPRVVYMTPQGHTFNQSMAEEFAKEEELVILCGHYEGIDERALELIVTDYVSIGDYVLTGGELPAMVVIDSVSRLVPGVLNNEESAQTESFSDGLLEYPQYTRPAEYKGLKVPDVLLSGHHGKIEEWRHKKSLERTQQFRPDMYEKYMNKEK